MNIKKLFSYITLIKRMSYKQIYWRIKKLLKYNFFYKYRKKQKLDEKKYIDIELGVFPFKMEVAKRDVNSKYYNNIISYANEIKCNNFNFLNIELDLGTDFDWNTKKTTDPLWKYNLNYFDFNLVLLKAYLYTEDYSYISKTEELMNRWIDETKLGEKITWDPYPVSRRVVNWIITLCFLRKYSLSNKEFISKVISSLVQQINFLYNNLELDLQNNHLTSNAKALIWSGLLLNEYPDSDKWFERGYSVFIKRIEEEIQLDGFQNENSSSYQMVTMQDYLEIILLLEIYDEGNTKKLFDILEKMFEALQAILKPDGSVPLLNDSVLNYPMEAKELMTVGAVLFNRGDFKWNSKKPDLSYLAWILGEEGCNKFDLLSEEIPSYNSVALKCSGFYIMRNGWDKDGTYLLFNLGNISPKHCPGHNHADALSFELYANGQTIMLDPGVYSYHDEDYRYYFKSTKSHNTVVINDKDQSEILGSFRFGRIAEVKQLEWQDNLGGNLVSAQHNGYRDIIHTRSIEFKRENLFIINDSIEGFGTKNIDLVFNMSPKLQNTKIKNDNKCICIFDNFKVILDININKTLGKFEIENGWISEEWNQLQKNKRIIYSIHEELPINIETKMYIK